MKKLLLFLAACFLMCLQSTSAQAKMPQKKREFVVSKYGDLRANGSIKDASGNTVCLMGPSLYWSCTAPTWWCRETVNYLVDQYHVQIIRLPVAIAHCPKCGTNSQTCEHGADNYLNNQEYTKQLVDAVVTAAIENDIYVIIDFHEHHAEDWVTQAREFFTYFATKWGTYPNVMYEIYNEPVCVNGTVVNYAKLIIPVIRAIDPDNIIIVGSAQYSREPHNVTDAGQNQTNIAYSWHGYTHYFHQGDWESSDADSWNTTIPVIVTEWGVNSSGDDGGLLDIYKSRGVINCFWSMSNIPEIWSVLKSDCTKKSGWSNEDMTENGAFLLSQTKGWVNFNPTDREEPEPTPEVYTEFVEETGTLTYYYDMQREERTGTTEVYDPVNDPDAVRFTDYYKKIVKCVIDPSMKNAPLTSTYGMFFGGLHSDPFDIQSLYNMTEIEGLKNLNTAAVTDMESMFFSCTGLTILDLSSFDTRNVTKMNGMFFGCNNLDLVDITSFDISNLTDMRMMFASCSKLKTIYCDKDWSTTTAQSDNMFLVCNSLVGGQGTPFDSDVKDKTYARLDGGTEAPGYFTEKPSIQGDLNDDGKVDIADAVTVLNIMAAGEYNAIADINGDEKVDIADFVTILNIMAAQ